MERGGRDEAGRAGVSGPCGAGPDGRLDGNGDLTQPRRRARRRGRGLAGGDSAALQSRRGSYNCGGMGGTDHCIAHL